MPMHTFEQAATIVAETGDDANNTLIWGYQTLPNLITSTNVLLTLTNFPSSNNVK